MKYKIELTKSQIIWLEFLLGKGFDGCFEGNPRERGFCDKIYDKVNKALKSEEEKDD